MPEEFRKSEVALSEKPLNQPAPLLRIDSLTLNNYRCFVECKVSLHQAHQWFFARRRRALATPPCDRRRFSGNFQSARFTDSGVLLRAGHQRA